MGHGELMSLRASESDAPLTIRLPHMTEEQFLAALHNVIDGWGVPYGAWDRERAETSGHSDMTR